MGRAYNDTFYDRILVLTNEGKKQKEIAKILKQEYEDHSAANPEDYKDWPDPDSITDSTVSKAKGRMKKKSSTESDSKNVKDTSSSSIVVKSENSSGDVIGISSDQIENYVISHHVKPYEEQKQFTRKSDGTAVYVHTLTYVVNCKDVTHTAVIGEYTDLDVPHT